MILLKSKSASFLSPTNVKIYLLLTKIAIDEWSNQLDAFKLIDLMDMLNPT